MPGFSTLIREAYPRSKADEERRNNPASFWLYRRVSWPFTWLFLACRTTPIQVTMLALLATVAGAVLLAAGALVAGAALLNVAYVLDQADGNVARFRGMASARGAWLDRIVGYLYLTFSPLWLAIGLASEGADGWSPRLITSLGACASIAIAARKTMLAGGGGEADEALSRGGGILAIPKAINSWAVFVMLIAVLAGVGTAYVAVFAAYATALALMAGLTKFRSLR